MALSRDQVSNLGLGAAALLATQNIDTRVQAQIAASNAERTTTGNPITGEGLPNAAPVVTRNWGQLPAVVPSTATSRPSTPSSSSIARLARCLRASARASWSRRTASPWICRATCGSPISRATKHMTVYFCRADERPGCLLSTHIRPSLAAATPCLRGRRAIGPTVRRCAH